MQISIPPLFAFGFASPWLLWGLALGAAPIIIHLLNRRKFKETQWAAMRFLLEAVRKNSRRLQIEQLVLLAVRALILILLVLALAQPMVEQLGAFFQPGQPVHRIIIVDASLSMGFEQREQALFDRARDVARRIVESGRQGDAFNLVRLSNIPPAAIVPTPAFQSSLVIEEIDQMQLPPGRGDLLSCLLRAADLLQLAPELTQKEIYILSDFQRATWTPDSSDDAARLREVMRKFDAAGRLELIDLGQSPAANLAVTHWDVGESFVTTGKPVPFRATIHNYSTAPVTGRAIEFLADDRLIEQRAIDVSAGADTLVGFSHVFPAGGEHRVEVRLQKDALPLDDQRWLAVPVKDHLRVLCVNGRTDPVPAGKATDFLELALSPAGPRPLPGVPRTAASRTTGLIESHVVNEGELPGVDLSQYDCVFLCDVRMFTEREARLLEVYLRGGGGVVWSLGPQTQADNYDLILYRGGDGILPARLGDRAGDPARRDEAFQFAGGELTHPIVNPFEGNPDAGLQSTQIYAYLRSVPGGKSASRVVLRFDSGDPAIVEAAVGRGRAILITTSVDDRWGVWPLWPSFVPVMHEIVQYAVSGGWNERQRLVGEALSGVFPAVTPAIDVSVFLPDDSARPARVTPAESLNEFLYEGTGHSGVYAVEIGNPVGRRELFAVNVDPRESNLVKYSPEELSHDLLPGIEFEYDTNWQERAAAPAEAPAAGRGGLTRWILYAALYLLLVEQLLAWNFRAGLFLLCPPLALWAFLRPQSKTGAALRT